MIVVSNTTPLINFAAIGRIDILQNLFGELFVPPPVIDELSMKMGLFPAVSNILTAPFITVEPITNSAMMGILRQELDEGEAAAILLAQQKQADLILLDEVSGRRIADMFGLVVIGSIGCLIEAKERGLIEFVRPVLDAMMTDARFWVSKSLYRTILEDIGEL